VFLIATVAIAQERTVENSLSRNVLTGNYSYYNYTGTSNDILIPTTRDTIDIVFELKKVNPVNFSVISKFDPVAGVDTIVYINVLGRNSENESWTSILSDSSAVISADGIVKTVSSHSSYVEQITIDTLLTSTALASTKDSLAFYVSNVTTSAVRYRFLNVRYILPGDDSVGTGVELKQTELKLFLEP
jgi:hypothetical protein